MRSHRLANFADRLDQSVAELLVPKMLAHFFDQPLPELLTAFAMDRFVPHDGELVGARGDENQNVAVLSVLVKAKPLKSLLCGNQRIVLQFAALNENANLAGGLRFDIANRFYDLVVFQPAQKFFRSHGLPTGAGASAAETAATAAKST